jgi:glycosyltransferase involved in cell wall biosynthesis
MLVEAVESVRTQTLPGSRWELIVVDDGSSDGTWSWLEAHGEGIRSLQNEGRRGPSAARNRGAEVARGTYLAFLDSDDLFLPDKLRRQLALLESSDLAICHCNETWLRDGKELKQLPKHEKRGGSIFEHCLPMCRISPSAAVIHRDLFESLGGFDEELEVAEDYELWLRLTCQHPVGFISDPLVIKRGGHEGQLSSRYGQIERFRIEALTRVLARAPLSREQRRAALRTLRHKCEIYARGCDKRGRHDEARRYLSLATSPCDA